uniref:Phospholipase B-like n=1 Tax=Arcella intermedia TaxID=1963864 RepID=A0A6B2L1J5_9EUKA
MVALVTVGTVGSEGADKLFSVYFDPEGYQWSVQEGNGGVASAYYIIQQNQTGWNTLHLETDGTYSDELQSYGAGFLEGCLTREEIWNSWLVFQAKANFNSSVTDFILNQDKWVRSMALSAPEGYWHQVLLVLYQLDGLLDGYAMHSPQERQISYTQLLYMVLSPELKDIRTFVNMRALEASGGAIIEEPEAPPGPPLGFHCSVLIKASSDGLNLLSAHDTWSHFSTMLRIYKYYTFSFNDPSTQVRKMAFSSYPANIQSTDDYYVLDNQLVVSETTNEVFNKSLFLEFMSEMSVPEWIRVIVANRMADSGESWVEVFSKFNSGTYNNQWQVVDYKLFEPGRPIRPGTLWIAEQIPGQVFSADKSDFLANGGFWPSYNIPYFPANYNISGYPTLYLKYGNKYSYQNSSRAQIFRRDAGKVQNMEDMKRIMRYNQFQTDPLSLQDACKSIAARCDLNAPWMEDAFYFAEGAIDCKIVDVSLVKELKSWVVAGPTWDSQPPFAWTNQWKNIPSYGMPRVYAFQFELTQPRF